MGEGTTVHAVGGSGRFEGPEATVGRAQTSPFCFLFTFFLPDEGKGGQTWWTEGHVGWMNGWVGWMSDRWIIRSLTTRDVWHSWVPKHPHARIYNRFAEMWASVSSL